MITSCQAPESNLANYRYLRKMLVNIIAFGGIAGPINTRSLSH